MLCVYPTIAWLTLHRSQTELECRAWGRRHPEQELGLAWVLARVLALVLHLVLVLANRQLSPARMPLVAPSPRRCLTPALCWR